LVEPNNPELNWETITDTELLQDLLESLYDRDLKEHRLKSTLTEESDRIRTIIIEREKFDEQKNQPVVAQTRAIKKSMLEKTSKLKKKDFWANFAYFLKNFGSRKFLA